MNEIILNTKRNIIDYLSNHPDLLYCEVVPDWIAEEQEKPFEKPIIVVQPINTDTGETQSGSLYATSNWTDMRFNVDVWTDKKTGGTIERDRISSALFSIFNFKDVNSLQVAHGIKSRGISGGTPIFEPEPQIYRCRMVLEVSALMVKIIPPPIELYAHYHLNEIAGVNVPDSSGNDRHGATVNMDDSAWVPGKLNNCLYFNGASEYVNLGDIANFERTDAFSIEFWLKTTVGSTAIISRMQLAPFPRGWAVFNTSAGKLGLRLCNSISPSNRIFLYGSTITTNNIDHHVVVTYDGSSSASGVIIYVDNNKDTLTIGADTLTETIQIAISCVLSSYGGVANFMTSKLDETVFYSRVLTPEEVAFRWNDGAGTEEIPSGV